MDFVDLSHPFVERMPAHMESPAFSCCPVFKLADHGTSTRTVTMGSHLGTHLDAPYRFHRDGQPAGALPLPLSTFVGPAIVVNVTNKAPHTRIMWKDVSSYEQRFRDGAKRKAIVLIRTGWSEYWDTQKYFDHPFLDTEVAQRILATGITVIGIDALSPDESVSPEREGSQWSQRDYGVHRTVLGSGHVIAENLTNLDAIQEGEWSVSLVPFKLTGGDGSPIRAFAGRREENNWR